MLLRPSIFSGLLLCVARAAPSQECLEQLTSIENNSTISEAQSTYYENIKASLANQAFDCNVDLQVENDDYWSGYKQDLSLSGACSLTDDLSSIEDKEAFQTACEGAGAVFKSPLTISLTCDGSSVFGGQDMAVIQDYAACVGPACSDEDLATELEPLTDVIVEDFKEVLGVGCSTVSVNTDGTSTASLQFSMIPSTSAASLLLLGQYFL